MIQTFKGFGVVNETEVDVFLEFPCFLYDPVNVDSLISGSSSFSKPSLDVWKFLVHVVLKPGMRDFKHDLTNMGDICINICFFYDLTDVGNLISGSFAFSKTSLNIWKSSVYVLLKNSLKDFEYYLASTQNECNCMVG